MTDYQDSFYQLVEYPYPIRPELNAYIILPRDLTLVEAQKIARFVETLVTPSETVGKVGVVGAPPERDPTSRPQETEP